MYLLLAYLDKMSVNPLVNVILSSTMVPKEIARKMLCIFLFFACLGGCIWIVQQQVSKYLKNTTFISQSFQNEMLHDLDIIICNAEGFKDGDSIEIQTVTKEKYMERVLDTNITLLDLYRKFFET